MIFLSYCRQPILYRLISKVTSPNDEEPKSLSTKKKRKNPQCLTQKPISHALKSISQDSCPNWCKQFSLDICQCEVGAGPIRATTLNHSISKTMIDFSLLASQNRSPTPNFHPFDYKTNYTIHNYPQTLRNHLHLPILSVFSF
jgi:hypothetical protein